MAALRPGLDLFAGALGAFGGGMAVLSQAQVVAKLCGSQPRRWFWMGMSYELNGHGILVKTVKTVWCHQTWLNPKYRFGGLVR